MDAIVDHVTELINPVAQDNHARPLRELQVHLDMTVTVDEEVDVRMILYVLLGEKHQVLLVLTHIGRLLATGTLHAAVLGPMQAEPHTPAGMQGGKGPLADTVVEEELDELERLVGVA